jgi:hypothetical protein
MNERVVVLLHDELRSVGLSLGYVPVEVIDLACSQASVEVSLRGIDGTGSNSGRAFVHVFV